MATKHARAVTVLEVVVILAIVGLFAAISLPRWPEGRNRSMRSGALTRMQQMASFIEEARRKTGSLPPAAPWRESANAVQLPVPEPMEARHADPFSRGGWLPISYHVEADRYLLASRGPDGDEDFIASPGWSRDERWLSPHAIGVLYDPTNGSASNGDVVLRSWVEGAAK